MLTLIDASGARLDGLTGELSMPVRGNWQARIELGEAVPAQGPITLEMQRSDGLGVDTFAGTLRYGGDWQGRGEAVIVGGAGGLLTSLEARHYAPKGNPIDARKVLEDILSAAGETLDPSSAVDGQLAQWTRVAAPGTRALSQLADYLGLEWRVTSAGAVWMGTDTYPAAAAADTGYQTSARPKARAIELRPDQATLRPGVTVQGQRVTRVVYRVGGPGVSLAAYYGTSNRAELFDAVSGILPDPVYGRTSGATVVSRDGNLLDVAVDDPLVASLRRIPFCSGLGGARVNLRPGDRVRVAFENGAPDGAYAHSADSAGEDGTNKGIARAGDTVSCGFFKVTGTPPKLVASHSGDPDAVELTGTITSGSTEAFLRP